jgi:hypothetical protein
MVDRATLKSTNAQQVSTNQTDKWEYAVIADVNWNPDSRNYYARICYFRTSGYEQVGIEGPPISPDDGPIIAKRKTLAKAAAILGQNGWEMVGDANIATGDKDPRRLYFKRRQK